MTGGGRERERQGKKNEKDKSEGRLDGMRTEGDEWRETNKQ